MYVNGKMIPVETISIIGRWGRKDNGKGGEFKYDIFDIRIFVNATMYPHLEQQLKKVSFVTEIFT
jgi:hypothetical protein